MIITIDGPSGAGKSTIAKELAARLGFEYLDTGAMYRAITWFLLEADIDITNEKEVETFIKQDSFNDNFNLAFVDNQIYISGKNISQDIREAKINDNVSLVSSYATIREMLVDKQRMISESKDIILDGRDTGSVVFPNADYKFYLTASVEERARRRHDQDKSLDYDQVLESIKKRDHADSTRELSPLKIPKDAIIINSDNKSIEETIDEFISHIRASGEEGLVI